MRTLTLTAGWPILLLALVPVVMAEDGPTAEQQLAAARKAGRPTFLLVTAARTPHLEDMRLAVEAARKRAPHVAVVEMDRAVAANKAIVKRYGLAGVPLPLVLIVAHNGAPGGGVGLGPKASEQMIALLPSPRKADTLLALFERKAALVVVGRADMPSRAMALAACREATADLENKAVLVEVDLLDKVEQGFLQVLGADLEAKDVVVHVYALSGRKTGVLVGPAATRAALVAAARKKAECCPGGKCGG